MMKNILALIGALAIVVLVGGAAYERFGPARAAPPAPAPAPAFQQTPPKAISELPITRHFSFPFEVGVLSAGVAPPFVQTLPPTLGFAIARLSSNAGLNYDATRAVVIRVNGNVVAQERVAAAASFSSNNGGPVVFEPPIIVAPGNTIEMFLEGPSGASFSNRLTISGFLLTPADFGL